MSMSRKVKTALDENRLLILGAQVLFGFQFQGVFQETFADVPSYTRIINSLALALMALTIGLLIAPSVQHRIVEEGTDTVRIHAVAGIFAGVAFLPLGSASASTSSFSDIVLGLRQPSGSPAASAPLWRCSGILLDLCCAPS
jgi:hypothetical protein